MKEEAEWSILSNNSVCASAVSTQWVLSTRATVLSDAHKFNRRLLWLLHWLNVAAQVTYILSVMIFRCTPVSTWLISVNQSLALQRDNIFYVYATSTMQPPQYITAYDWQAFYKLPQIHTPHFCREVVTSVTPHFFERVVVWVWCDQHKNFSQFVWCVDLGKLGRCVPP